MSTNSGGQHPVEEIIRHFKIGDGVFSFKPFGSGHINDTFLIESKDQKNKYLLQRINHEVFKDVEGLMQNMHLVTSNLQQQLSAAHEQEFTTVSIIPSIDNKLYYKDSTANYWRVQTFIANSISYDTVTSENQAFEAGYAFGKFQLLLQNMEVENIKETIPDFHNMEYRFRNLEEAIRIDPVARKASVQEEIDFALQRRNAMEGLYVKVRNGQVPIRITHNDTKFNNVLLDQQTHKAICIIDLDTVMPGVAWYDFGDSIRTVVNTSEEDETDLSKIKVDMDFFEAFCNGYLQETAVLLSDLEVSELAFAAQYMTFIMGLRFLTDYISGDVYYKIKHKNHNLERARAQFKLVLEMEERGHEMNEIVKKIYRTYS